MPSPLGAELPENVLLLMLTVSLLKRPPPKKPAELLAKVLLLMLTVPLLKRPPPSKLAALLAKVLFVIFTVPELTRPPPFSRPPEKPWATVRALSVRVTPLLCTTSTCTLLLPSRVTLWPLPSRVILPAIVSVFVRGIAPLQAKVMVSL